MNARVLASFVAALAMLGSLPFWWWLQQRQAAPRDVVVAAAPSSPHESPAVLPTTPEVTPPAGEAAAPSSEAANAVAPSAEPARPEKPVPELVTGPDPGRSPIADRLNAEDGSIDQDLLIVTRLLENYLLEFGSNPVGSNREITAQLSGRNPRHHTPLPQDVPAIAADGQLVDRWGTPFFFHALSGRSMEVRSAGPDHELYTADDAVFTPVAR